MHLRVATRGRPTVLALSVLLASAGWGVVHAPPAAAAVCPANPGTANGDCSSVPAFTAQPGGVCASEEGPNTIVAKTTTISFNGIPRATLDLRYRAACRSVWGRVISSTGQNLRNFYVWVNRPSTNCSLGFGDTSFLALQIYNTVNPQPLTGPFRIWSTKLDDTNCVARAWGALKFNYAENGGVGQYTGIGDVYTNTALF
jgi:hypothetical protein